MRERAFSLDPSKSGSLLPTHTQHGIPPIVPSLRRAGDVGKSAPSPFPRGHGAWGGGNPTLGGYSGAGHWGASLGEVPPLPFALDECSLTPRPPPHPLNKQHRPPHPPHTQRDWCPGNLSYSFPGSTTGNAGEPTVGGVRWRALERCLAGAKTLARGQVSTISWLCKLKQVSQPL